MTAPIPSAAPGGTVESSGGADLLGWSALPLLCSTSSGTWLFVTDRSTGWMSRGSLADAHFENVPLPEGGPWPFETGSLEGVVIDGDAFARGADDLAIEHCVAEAYRAVVTDAHVLIACGERRVPRRLRDLREYGRHSAPEWRKALSRRPDVSPAASATFDGNRLTEVTLLGNGGPASGAGGDSRRMVLRAPVGDRGGVLQAMVADTSNAAGVDVQIERIAVRKIGKTAVFLSGADGRRFIVRIARTPIARLRAARNFEALRSLHSSSLPSPLTEVVPRAVVQGSCGPYEYFVEECLPGHAGPSRHAAQRAGWPVAPVEYITALHAATVHHVDVDDEVRRRFIVEPTTTIGRVCASPAADRVLQGLRAGCEAALNDQVVLPLVRTHGDLTESNCLFDASGRLTGVVDWEISDPKGLPFVDLLQLMPAPGESGRVARWRRFDAWLELWRDPERVVSGAIFESYVRDLELKVSVIPALVLAHWLAHVADRIDARRDDQRWMRLRVWQPLETLGKVLRD